jgi:hypothetical protein
MKSGVNEVVRFVARLRPATRYGIAAVVLALLLFWQAEMFGESLGKALYYLTH